MSTLAEVLAAHRPVHDPNGHINGTVPGSVAVYDCYSECVVNATLEDCIAHQVEAVAAEAGLAVIQLPEPNSKGAWSISAPSDLRVEDGEVVQVLPQSTGWTEAFRSPELVRKIAAALLAAANAAEAVNA